MDERRTCERDIMRLTPHPSNQRQGPSRFSSIVVISSLSLPRRRPWPARALTLSRM